jgi:hypothetical protein
MAGSDRPNVPEDRALHIKVCRADQKRASPAILTLNGNEHLLVGIFRNQPKERIGVGERIAENCTRNPTMIVDIGRPNAGIACA